MGFITGTVSGLISNSSINYFHIKDWEGTVNEKRLIIPESKDLREINIYSDKLIDLYWGNQVNPFYSFFDQIFVDTSCGMSLSIEPLDGDANIKILVRSTKPINYSIGEALMIPVKIRLLLGTGDNYIPRNESDFDDDSTQYLINLNKLKNSDSGTTGYKMFDIFSFYPGKNVDFNIIVESVGNYGNIALQLFDPLDIGEAIFDCANDVVNLEFNNLGSNFVGNLTRNALYKDVINGSVTISPDFSRHAGRFVAVNTETENYDTAIIKSYTPNSDTYKGGTFVLTGEF